MSSVLLTEDDLTCASPSPPAVQALRAKKALPVEMVELVRFAASERCLQLRSKKLGQR